MILPYLIDTYSFTLFDIIFGSCYFINYDIIEAKLEYLKMRHILGQRMC